MIVLKFSFIVVFLEIVFILNNASVTFRFTKMFRKVAEVKLFGCGEDWFSNFYNKKSVVDLHNSID